MQCRVLSSALTIELNPCHLAQRKVSSVVKAYRKFDHRQRVELVWQNICWKDSAPAFAYGTSDQSDLDLTFDHRIDTVVILFKDERRPINGRVRQFKRCRWVL
jgi:hypothetical protein